MALADVEYRPTIPPPIHFKPPTVEGCFQQIEQIVASQSGPFKSDGGQVTIMPRHDLSRLTEDPTQKLSYSVITPSTEYTLSRWTDPDGTSQFSGKYWDLDSEQSLPLGKHLHHLQSTLNLGFKPTGSQSR